MLPATLCLIMTRYVWSAQLGRVTVLRHEVALEEELQVQGRRYDLWGVVSQSQGHCWAHVRQGQQWWCCNDSDVRTVRQLDVGRSWTIAFYAQVADPQ